MGVWVYVYVGGVWWVRFTGTVTPGISEHEIITCVLFEVVVIVFPRESVTPKGT